MADHDTDQPISDVGANPQDQQFGKQAAEDAERVDKGEQPHHDGDTEHHAGGKADPA